MPDEEITATAIIFKPVGAASYTVAVQASDSAHGSVAASAAAASEHSPVTVSAEAKDGYTFVRWEATGIQLTEGQKEAGTLNFTMPGNQVSLTAVFDVNVPRAITAKANNAAYGSASALPASAPERDSVTATATPNTGYTFAEWQAQGVTLTEEQRKTNPLTFTMSSKAVTLTAVFEPEKIYQLRTFVFPDQSGKVTSSVTSAPAGATVTIKAEPAPGYTFVSWNTSYLKPEQMSQPEVTFTMPARDFGIGASIKSLKSYEVITKTNDDSMGSIALSPRTPSAGTFVMCDAKPKPGYKFVRWEVDGFWQSDGNKVNPNIAFTMPDKTVTITAFFEKAAPTYRTITQSRGRFWGTTTATPNVAEKDAEVTAAAAPASGYRFVRWECADLDLSGGKEQQNPLVYQMPAKPITLTAVYERAKYDVTAKPQNASYGTVSTDKPQAQKDESVTVTATSNAGYNFVRWECQGLNLSAVQMTSHTVTFPMPDKEVTLTAVFEKVVYAVTAKSSDETHGSAATNLALAVEGTSITVTAAPKNGFRFKAWEASGLTLNATQPADNPLTFAMPDQDVTVTAVFEAEAVPPPVTPTGYQIQAKARDGVMGQAIADKNTALEHDAVSVTAAPSSGYVFSRWEANGTALTPAQETANPLTFTMPPSDVQLTAIFAPVRYQVTATVNDAGAGDASPNVASASKDELVKLTAVPAPGYAFEKWTAVGISLSDAQEKANPTTVVMPDNSVTMTAVFTKTPALHAAAASTSDAAMGTAAVSPGQAAQGEAITLRAQANSGYEFSGWTAAGYTLRPEETNMPILMVSMPDNDVSFTANFRALAKKHAVQVRVKDDEGGSMIAAQSIEKDSRAAKPDAPVRDDYIFTGWFADEACSKRYDFTQGVTAELTLYAGWSPLLPEKKNLSYMTGYSDGTFCPDAPMTRAEATAVFYRVMGEPGAGISSRFTDVSEDAWYFDAVTCLAGKGVIAGYPDGSFEPDEPVTRAEFTAMAMRFADMPINIGKEFPDVAADYWAAGWISTAANRGYISGYPDGSFAPEKLITRAEVVTVVNRVIGCEGVEQGVKFSDVTSSHWAYQDIAAAAIEHHD